MPYITTFERKGIQKGLQQKAREDVIEVLEIRFGSIPSLMIEGITQENDPETLKRLLRQAVTVDSIETFQQYLNETLTQ